MSFDSLFVPNMSGNSDEILEIDNDTGNTTATHTLSGDVGAMDRDSDGNLFASVDRHICKYDSDLNLIWQSDSQTYTEMALIVADNGNIVFAGGGSRVCRVDGDTGEVIWSNYDTSIDCWDLSYGGGYLWAQTDHDSDDRRYDLSSGRYDEEELVGYLDDSVGIIYYNGYLYTSEHQRTNIYKSDSFTEGDTIQDGSFTVNNNTNLHIDRDGLYTGGRYGSVAHIDFDGNTQWNVDLDGDPTVSNVEVSPDSLWVCTRYNGLYRMNKSNGDVLWKNEDTNFSLYPDYSLGGFPNLDSYGGENWEVTIDVSGTVTQDGDPVDGADVIIIDDEEDEFAARAVSDGNGEWHAEAPESTLHVVAQYKNHTGDVFHSESYPYVVGED